MVSRYNKFVYWELESKESAKRLCETLKRHRDRAWARYLWKVDILFWVAGTRCYAQIPVDRSQEVLPLLQEYAKAWEQLSPYKPKIVQFCEEV